MSKNYVPYYAIVEIIYKCNLKCLHCASSLNNNPQRESLLSDSELYDLFDQLKALGCQYITLSGGEPLLHPSWDKFAQYLRENGIIPTMVSNGMLIDSKMANRIKNSGLRVVALSLDGNEDVHNYIRNNKEAYNNVIKAAKNLKDVGMQVNFITSVTKKNLHMLHYIENLVYELNGDFWQIQLGSAIGSLKDNIELALDPKDTKSVVDFIIEAKNRNKVKITTSDTIGYCYQEDILNLNQKTGHVTKFSGCYAGKRVIGIEANGNVKGCLSLQDDRFIEGNIRKEKLSEIWNKEGNFSYTRNFDTHLLSGVCQDCKYGEKCKGGCSFMSLGATGSLHNNPYCIQHYI